jgi:hypothetical protein
VANSEGIMLKCTIELIPHGDVTMKERLATVIIVNDGTGTPELGNYIVHIVDKKDGVSKGRVENYPRLQHGPAFLVMKAIEACMKDI